MAGFHDWAQIVPVVEHGFSKSKAVPPDHHYLLRMA